MNSEKKTGILLLAVFVIMTGLLFAGDLPAVERGAGQDQAAAFSETENHSETYDLPETQVREICVYVCGQVNSPGVYALADTARVNDAIEMAGGLTEAANLSGLNLAQPLTDGQKLYIPAAGEEVQKEALPAAEGCVNINTADEAALTSLPGIGQTRAAAIIAYREKHGPFSDARDLMQVSGIGESLFAQLEDKVTIN